MVKNNIAGHRLWLSNSRIPLLEAGTARRLNIEDKISTHDDPQPTSQADQKPVSEMGYPADNLLGKELPFNIVNVIEISYMNQRLLSHHSLAINYKRDASKAIRCTKVAQYISSTPGPRYLDLESHLKQKADQHDHHRYNLFNASSALLE